MLVFPKIAGKKFFTFSTGFSTGKKEKPPANHRVYRGMTGFCTILHRGVESVIQFTEQQD